MRTAKQAKAQLTPQLNGRRRSNLSYWKVGTAPVGEPNPHYDPAIASQFLVDAYPPPEEVASA